MKKGLQLFLTLFLSMYYIEVYAQSKAAFSMSDSAVCDGESVIFTNQSTGATSYRWYVNNQQVSSATSASFRTSGTTTYVVALVARSAAGNDTAYDCFRSMVAPVYNYSFDQGFSSGTVCLGREFTISPWSRFEGVDSVHWEFGDGNSSNLRFPRIKYTKAGIYNLKLEIFGRCGTDTDSKQLTVTSSENAKPQMDILISDQVCPGEIFNVSGFDLVDAGLEDVRIHMGDGNSTIKRDFSYHYDKEGLYIVSVVGENACGLDSISRQIHVTDTSHRPSNIYASPRETCPGTPVRVQMNLTGNDWAIINYGDGQKDTFTSDKQFVDHTYSMVGSYDIQAEFHPECGKGLGSSYNVSILDQVNPGPFTVQPNSTRVCQGETVRFTMPYLQPTDTLRIQFGDGADTTLIGTQSPIEHVYTRTGFLFLRATVTNICGNSRNSNSSLRVGNYSLDPKLEIGFASNGVSTCKGDTVSYFASSTRNRQYKSVLWKFSDGMEMSGFNVNRAYEKTGTYQVMCTLTDMCGSKYRMAHKIDIISSMNNPRAIFWHQPEADCVGNEILFDNTTQNASKMTWDFGDGTVEEPKPEDFHTFHTYTKAGVYYPKLTAENGCGTDTETRKHVAIEGPSANFTTSADFGVAGDTVRFLAPGSKATDYEWKLPDGSTSNEKEISYIFKRTGSYTISLRASGRFGCEDFKEINFNVGNTSNRKTGYAKETIVFPNPNTGLLNIKKGNNLSNEISIFDIYGRAIYVGKFVDSKIDLKGIGIPSGTYIIRIGNEELSSTHTVVLY